MEAGETPECALARELKEEASAALLHFEKIGIQHADDLDLGSSYQAFYWCRVILGVDFSPKHEVTERHLVSPDEFLDRLFWGRKDPKAPMLLDRALEIEREFTFHQMNRRIDGASI